jgi:hypothetical protein
LLITEDYTAVVNAATKEIFYIRAAMLVRHAMPPKEPLVREPLRLDMQFALKAQFKWSHFAPVLAPPRPV